MCLIVNLSISDTTAQAPKCYSQEFRDNYSTNNDYFKLESPRRLKVDLRSKMIIPVVVHIVYKNEENNISKEQIYSQIDALNWAFSHNNKDQLPTIFQSISSSSEIQFCLTSIDPNGNSTNGITRTQTTINQIGSPRTTAIKYEQLGGKTAWDTKRYLNIWVGDLGNDLLGYSSFPDIAGSNIDGIVIDARYFGTIHTKLLKAPYLLGRTLVHEVGHYLGLCHLGGCSNISCFADDLIDDTPIQGVSYLFLNCPTHPQISCDSEDMFMNYMALTPDPCLLAFTKGQVIKMTEELQTNRSELFRSDACKFYRENTLEENISIVQKADLGLILIQPKVPFTEAVKLEIYDMKGSLIQRSELTDKYLVKIEVPFSQGVYIFYFYNANNQYSKKIFIYQ